MHGSLNQKQITVHTVRKQKVHTERGRLDGQLDSYLVVPVVVYVRLDLWRDNLGSLHSFDLS